MEYLIPIVLFSLSVYFLYKKFKLSYEKGKCGNCSLSAGCGKIEPSQRKGS